MTEVNGIEIACGKKLCNSLHSNDVLMSNELLFTFQLVLEHTTLGFKMFVITTLSAILIW